jgi:hypothetical protein
MKIEFMLLKACTRFGLGSHIKSTQQCCINGGVVALQIDIRLWKQGNYYCTLFDQNWNNIIKRCSQGQFAIYYTLAFTP